MRVLNYFLKNFRHVCKSQEFADKNVSVLSYRLYSAKSSETFKPDSVDEKSNVKKLLDDAADLQEDLPETSQWHTSPYPKGAVNRNQALHSLRPMIDPRETTIIVFPGQGVQYVGMGKSIIKFPTVRDIFEAASHIVKYDVLKLCLEGPETKLNKTNFQQMALFVCSMGALEALKEERPSVVERCVATAGFSLGEIPALVFAGVLEFEDAVRLVKIRGEAMQLAAEISPGAMTTIFYSPATKLGNVLHDAKAYAEKEGVENPYCAVSNYLFPHCKIIAGHKQAIEFVEANGKNYGIKKTRRLPVSGAFHTPLMEPASEAVAAALKHMKVNDPSIAVHSNISGKRYMNAQQVRKLLPKQIVAPVRWEQTLHIIYERSSENPVFPLTYECGPGKSLTTILKMVNGKAWESCYNVPV